MPADNGQFDAKYPTYVFISKTICEKFRNTRSTTERSGMSILIKSTILHEMVHWGNSLDGKPNSAR